MLKTHPLSILRAHRADELPPGAFRAAFYLWNAVILLLSAAGITVLSLLLGIGMMDVELFFDYFRKPLLFALNFLPVALLQLLFLCLFNRQWLAFLGNAILILGAAAGDFYKLKFRTEPFVFSDLSAISTAFGVMGNFNMRPNTRLLLAIASTLLGAVFLFFFAGGRLRARGRICTAALLLLSLYPLGRFVYRSETLYDSPRTSSSHVIPYWTQQRQVSKGFVYQFLYSIHESGQDAPQGYSADKAAALLDMYEDAAIPADRRFNLLVFQLEAFSDLRTLGVPDIAEDAYAAYDQLREESLHGALIANVFAGGTVNTERCFLTGCSYLADYRRPSGSYVWYLDGQGYTTLGSHPHHQSFYNRVNINRYLGFSDYWFYENHYEQAIDALPHPWFSDAVFFPAVRDQFLAHLAAGESVFSFNVSMQGHGPYADDSYLYPDRLWEGAGYSESTRCIVNNYLGSVRETSGFLLQTAEQLRACEEPIVLLVYGDHKPWLGDGNAAYQELGVDLDPSSEAGFFNHYATEYLIWANDAALALLDGELSGDGPAISPGALMGLLFERLGWPGSAFMQLGREVYAALPVINSNGYYIENGTYTRELSPAGAALLHEYRCVQYYYHDLLIQQQK